jgi:diguanylate cyclase
VVAAGTMRFAALRRRLRALEEQALTDPLTGAFNRRHLDACLTVAVERRGRSGEPAALLLIDVDRFKAINDAAGHPAGDEVLKSLVGVLAERARKIDALFRIGGEEFALLLSGATAADAVLVAEDLRLRVATAALLEGQDVTISIGVSELREAQSIHDWMAGADAALYRAKQGGRNRVAVSTAGPPAGDQPDRREVRVPVPVPMR